MCVAYLFSIWQLFTSDKGRRNINERLAKDAGNGKDFLLGMDAIFVPHLLVILEQAALRRKKVRNVNAYLDPSVVYAVRILVSFFITCLPKSISYLKPWYFDFKLPRNIAAVTVAIDLAPIVTLLPFRYHLL